jgi:hypothetical protein
MNRAPPSPRLAPESISGISRPRPDKNRPAVRPVPESLPFGDKRAAPEKPTLVSGSSRPPRGPPGCTSVASAEETHNPAIARPVARALVARALASAETPTNASAEKTLKPGSVNRPARINTRASKFLLLCLALYLPSHPAYAGNAPVGGGGSCSYSLAFDSSVGQQQAYNNGLYTCLSASSEWTPEALYIGNTLASGSAAACTSSADAGLLEYTGAHIWYCNGTNFVNVTTGSLINVDIQLAAGTAAAPSLSFYEDTTSGIYQAASHTLNFATDGAEVANFDSTGDFNLTNAGATGTGKYEINNNNVLALPDKVTTSIAVGPSALTSQNATSSDNTAVGASALTSATSDTTSTAIGYSALTSQKAGGPNDALGTNAGANITTGIDNVAIGFEALQGVSATPLYGVSATPLYGSDNTAVGDSALEAIEATAGANTAVGQAALAALTTGSSNTAVGASALTSATSDTQSTAIGYSALASQKAGGPNDAIGYNAGASITTGIDNVAIGAEALQGVSATPLYGVSATPLYGSQNTAVGYTALEAA